MISEMPEKKSIYLTSLAVLMFFTANLAASEPILHLGFDGNTTPASESTLKALPGNTTQVDYSKGIAGKSIICGKTPGINYYLKEHAVLKQGSISLWFRWDEPDSESYIQMARFFAADGNELMLYILPHRHFAFQALRRGPAFNVIEKTRLFAVRHIIDQWREKPGQWHFIAVTWTPEKAYVYFDGIPVAENPLFAGTPVKFYAFRIAEPSYSWEKGRMTGKNYHIDEFKIYDKSLPHMEIIETYEKLKAPIASEDVF